MPLTGGCRDAAALRRRLLDLFAALERDPAAWRATVAAARRLLTRPGAPD